MSTPSWWMPEAWAKALAPTTALFGWTTKPVICETSRDAGTICVVSMRVATPKASRAGLDRHHHLLERGVAGPLSQAVDRALDLPRAAECHAGERVGDGHAEIVVAMHRPDRFIRVRNPLPERPYERAELFRHRVPDGVRDVDGRGAFFDRRLEHATQEIEIRATAVLGRKLDVGTVIARELHREPRGLVYLVRRHAELLLHVQRARREEGVDAPRLRPLQGLDTARDIAVVGAAEASHGRVLDGIGDRRAPPRSRRSRRPGSRPRSRRRAGARAASRSAASPPGSWRRPDSAPRRAAWCRR